jgi:hypothetical protein
MNMENDSNHAKKFLILSELYFKTSGKTFIDISSRELEEYLDAINDDSPSTAMEQYLS